MPKISARLKAQVVERAKDLCEYCQTSRMIVIDLEVDHVHPNSKGGGNILANLALTCSYCNKRKRDKQTATDPQTGNIVPLFNPRIHHWPDHFYWNETGTKIEGLTEIGRAMISLLNMNREDAVQARARWVSAGWHPPKRK